MASELHEALRRHYGHHSGAAEAGGAEWVELSCLGLPSQAGAFNIVVGLSDIQGRHYEDIEPHLWRDVPSAFRWVRARDEGALQSALVDSGLAAAAPDETRGASRARVGDEGTPTHTAHA